MSNKAYKIMPGTKKAPGKPIRVNEADKLSLKESRINYKIWKFIPFALNLCNFLGYALIIQEVQSQRSCDAVARVYRIFHLLSTKGTRTDMTCVWLIQIWTFADPVVMTWPMHSNEPWYLFQQKC